MRKRIVIPALLLLGGIAFGQISNTATIDIEAEKAAIHKLMDNYEAELADGDISTLESSLAADALVCGTDPSEFWNKRQFLELMNQDSDNPPPGVKNLGDRKIKVSPDGLTAIVVTQYVIDWSPNIPWRQVYHFRKTKDRWMIDFVNIAFVPKNEDIQRINDALD